MLVFQGRIRKVFGSWRPSFLALWNISLSSKFIDIIFSVCFSLATVFFLLLFGKKSTSQYAHWPSFHFHQFHLISQRQHQQCEANHRKNLKCLWVFSLVGACVTITTLLVGPSGVLSKGWHESVCNILLQVFQDLVCEVAHLNMVLDSPVTFDQSCESRWKVISDCRVDFLGIEKRALLPDSFQVKVEKYCSENSFFT